MTTDTKALRALLDAYKASILITPVDDELEEARAKANAACKKLGCGLIAASQYLLDAADERDVLKLELARLRGVLGHIVEIGKRDMTSPEGATK